MTNCEEEDAQGIVHGGSQTPKVEFYLCQDCITAK